MPRTTHAVMLRGFRPGVKHFAQRAEAVTNLYLH